MSGNRNWHTDRQRRRMRSAGTTDAKDNPPAFTPMLPLRRRPRRQSREETRAILAAAKANTDDDELDRLLAAAAKRD